MTEPNQENPDGAPCVAIGGKVWPVPKMAFRQLEPMQERLDRMWAVLVNEKRPMGELTQAEMRDIATVVHIGLTRAHPSMDFEEFSDLATTRAELCGAFLIVGAQAYGIRPRATSGEAEGAAASPQTTGQ